MDDSKIKHLELIQGVISRLAENSFLLKGWNVTLVAALFALAAQGTDITFAFIAPFAALAFWGLDAYYLRQERLYRQLYEEVCTALDTTPVPLFSLDVTRYKREVHSWFRTLWSPTIVSLHGLTVVVAFAIIAVKLLVL